MIKSYLKEKTTELKNIFKCKFPFIWKQIRKIYRQLNSKRKWKQLLITRYSRLNEADVENFKHLCDTNARIYKKGTMNDRLNSLLRSVYIFSEEGRFFYSIDVFQTLFTSDIIMDNDTFDYESIISQPLSSFFLNEDAEGSSYIKESNKSLEAVLRYLSRCIEWVNNSELKNKNKISEWLRNMENGSAHSLEEALQRILFMNSILWQTNHRLVGLGRLDFILNDLYQIETNMHSKEEIHEMISDFLMTLHRYYWFKSDALMGDTGQIIILGGLNPDGSYFANDLTYLFISTIESLQKPDPKILLRFSNNMPEKLMYKAVNCIATGIGCPLISNDNQIIPALINFGYQPEDAYNYVTSACWEPLIPGTSHEQNNIGMVNFLEPFRMISRCNGFNEINNENELFNAYAQQLREHINFVCNELDNIDWAKDPLVSIFTKNSRDSLCDISDGGGKYNNYGVLSIGLSNAVNSFMNVKRFVFDENKFTLKEMDLASRQNFQNNPQMFEILKSSDKLFGRDTEEAIELSKQIVDVANQEICRYKNRFGGKAKLGLSSPSYIDASKDFPATFDGRKYGEPFAVHISSDVNAYTEIMQFAAKLDYSGARFNGNVVDIIVSPNFIKNNLHKFTDMLIRSMELGVFQIQVNVVSSETLIAARKNPKDFPNLIVRVWGFNAYYIELPNEYKDYLIERALNSERVN